jgi:hypothetical protein
MFGNRQRSRPCVYQVPPSIRTPFKNGDSPSGSRAVNKLVVHSAGARAFLSCGRPLLHKQLQAKYFPLRSGELDFRAGEWPLTRVARNQQEPVPASISRSGVWTVKSTGKVLRIPAPRTGNWQESFGGWEGFTAEIHRSIGKKLGSGVLTLSQPSSKVLKKATT